MGEIPVSDTTKHAAVPTQFAADVAELRLIGEWLNARHPFPEDSDGDRVLAAADELERLAGLLCTPQERAVIEAAKALAADWAGYESGVPDWDTETLVLIAAVDHLAAPGPKEAT